MEYKIEKIANSMNNIIHFWWYKKSQIAENRNPKAVKIFEPSEDKVAWAHALQRRGKPLPLQITFRDGEMWDCQSYPPSISFTTR
jgi:hypothetical protein